MSDRLIDFALLLGWSSSLTYRRESFDDWYERTHDGESTCADLAGFSLRVPAGPLEAPVEH